MENAEMSVIGKDVEIVGTIKSAGSVRIDGKLDGELVCAGDVQVGKTAHVKGNINTNSVVIEGAITGNVEAKDKIDMKSSARVSGDIKAKRLAVEDGVTFMGRSEVNPGGTAAASAPASAAGGEKADARSPAQAGKSQSGGK
jgi:cytoskeletal protein CcmA (bactofilin family)